MIDLSHNLIHHLITQYGSIALFCLLAFGIIGLPVPDETLLVVAGYMAAKGNLHLVAVLVASILGSASGITVSYLLGRYLGSELVLRCGKYIGLTKANIQKAHDWFQRFGKYLLAIGYFIPGLRHFTGISAGVSKLDYPTFALFAYTGSVLWGSTFSLLGYFFFNEWHHWVI